uniref:Ig-like domain-containing protein n=1 Tax=Leptobrachium leishanense TaxID=445787 RepID=A0A8C5PIV5_9ANUR
MSKAVVLNHVNHHISASSLEAPTVQIVTSEVPGNQEQIIVCEARGFYPEAITVNWILNGKPAETPGRNADGTFNKRIYYHTHPSLDNKPEDISCEVQHETLFSPITETQIRRFSKFQIK